ncbi:MAG: MraY family glycosyltransferase, partial [Kiritimatiellia bacterium]
MKAKTLEIKGDSIRRVFILLAFFLLAASLMGYLLNPVHAMLFASSVCVVYVATPLVMRLAHRAGAVDYPGGRRIHAMPTPRWGGIPVYAGVIAALLLASPNYMPNVRAMIIGATLVLAAGVADDVFGLRASLKLAVQAAACLVLIADGVHVTFLPNVWWGFAGEWVITIVWIVGITNAVNFLDGMDGLVPGLVAGTSMIYFVLSILVDSPMLAYCSIALFGASLCFLSFNVKPARIFLGDGGSNFMGFFLAALSIHGTWAKSNPLVSYFIPILVLSVPIYDMVFTTCSRVLSGRVKSLKSWLEFTGTDHIHHRLEALGLSRGKVVITIWFLNMAVGLGAITLFEARTYGGVALVVQAVCIYVVLALFEILGSRKRAADIGDRGLTN